MKIYAQHGCGEGKKITEGLEKNFIQGAILSPRDIAPDKLKKKLKEYSEINSDAEILFDPQFYVNSLKNDPNFKIRKLAEYQKKYFSFHSRNNLEIEKNISDIIKKTISFQHNLGFSSIISPNITISNSFDSIDASIAKNFIRLAKKNYFSKDKKFLYTTLCISSTALINFSELQEFLSAITLFENPSDGFYLIISVPSYDSVYEIFNKDVIAGWMLLNYTLNMNGFKVINGYSDLISPLLSLAGGSVGCTGWFGNLRSFSLQQKFAPIPREGGSQAIPRYLSISLMNRLRFNEFDFLKSRNPLIVNNLNSDSYFKEEIVRSNEILQTWESLSSLCGSFSANTSEENLKIFNEKINVAKALYDRIAFHRLDPKSSNFHLEAFEEGIAKFRRLAEI